jgi:Big-like domain-containing protein
MLSGRIFAAKRLPLTIAFAALMVAAFGAGCQGFFVKPTLTSITINPTAPSIQLSKTLNVQAFGVNSDGQGANLTSGVSWSTSDPTIVTVTGTGSATLTGVAIGTATITASAQSVTNTATATVYITIGSLTMAPSSQSMAATATTPLPFIVTANGSVDVSSTATLNVYQGGVLQSTITCAYNASASPAGQYCTSNAAAVGTYQVVATYPGTTLTATSTLTIS